MNVETAEDSELTLNIMRTNIKEWINVNLTITEKFSCCFYGKSSIKTPPPTGRLIYFTPIWGPGGGLFNLEKMMVSVLHKELEYKVENLKYKKVGGHAKIRIKSELPAGE